MSAPVIILGAGGHAHVLSDVLRLIGVDVAGIVCREKELYGKQQWGYPVLGSDETVLEHPPGSVRLVNAVGSVDSMKTRAALFRRFKALGYSFASVIHPAAYVSDSASLGEGVQVLVRSVVQPGVVLGDNSIVNTAAVVEHDCLVGRHVHLAPGSLLCGEVKVGDESHIGAGAIVIQGRSIGNGAFIAAAALVTRDIADGQRVAGVPAVEM